MPVPGHACMDDMACGDVQGRKEGGGAVALVVVRHGAGSALLQREAGLGAVQSLDLALLVEGEDHGVVRRVHVDAYHVVELLDEAGIAGKLEAPDLMRLESVLAPDPPDGHMVDSQGLAHQPTGPVGRLLGRRIFASRLLDDLLLDLAGDRAGSAGAGSVALDSIESLRFVAPHPEARRVPGDTHGRSDAATRFSPGGGQDNLGSFHLPPRQRPRPHPRLENPSIPPSQSQLLGRSSHGHQYRRPWHYGLETFVTVH